MFKLHCPVARKEELVIQELAEEILVYDLEMNKAHCLNRTAAFVWKFCDGKNTIADITRLLAETEGQPVSDELVWLAIDQLSQKNLLGKAPIAWTIKRRTNEMEYKSSSQLIDAINNAPNI